MAIGSKLGAFVDIATNTSKAAIKNSDDAAKAAVDVAKKDGLDLAAQAAKAAEAAADNFTRFLKPLAKLSDESADGFRSGIKKFLEANPGKTIGDMPLDDMSALVGPKGINSLVDAGVAGSGLAAGALKAAKKAPWKSMMLIGAGYGGFLWTIDHLEDVEEDERECVRTCLPRNWDNYYAASTVDGAELPDLDYKTKSDYADEYKKQTDKDLPDDVIFCADPMVECGTYCESECGDRYSTVFEKAAENVGRSAGKGAKGLKDASGIGDLFENAFDGFGNTIMTIGIGLAIIFLIAVAIYATRSAKRGSQ